MLVPFDLELQAKHGTNSEIPPPPKDPIKKAEWLSTYLADRLYESVILNEQLPPPEKNAEVLRFARAITAATPNHEIFAAREAIRQDEAEAETRKLGGEVRSAKTPRAGYLRANAPKRVDK